MDRQQISQITGVAAPYLWLDEVLEISDERILARKFLDPALPIFESHFVDFPLFPGSLQCEAAFQASSVLIARTQPVDANAIPVIARVRNVKFRKMARPGDELQIEVHLLDRTERAMSLKGWVRCGDDITTQLDFLATEAVRGG